MSNPHFMQMLQKMAAIHEKKNHDYSSVGPFQNFVRSSEISNWFVHPMDRAFANLVGTKLARLAALLSTDRDPLNEPIEDTFLDLATYCGLWYSWRESIKPSQKAQDYESHEKHVETLKDLVEQDSHMAGNTTGSATTADLKDPNLMDKDPVAWIPTHVLPNTTICCNCNDRIIDKTAFAKHTPKGNQYMHLANCYTGQFTQRG